MSGPLKFILPIILASHAAPISFPPPPGNRLRDSLGRPRIIIAASGCPVGQF
jgi:hypothetical protein